MVTCMLMLFGTILKDIQYEVHPLLLYCILHFLFDFLFSIYSLGTPALTLVDLFKSADSIHGSRLWK